jgi:hypothetical protein
MVYPGSATLAFVMTGEDGQSCTNFHNRRTVGKPNRFCRKTKEPPEANRSPAFLINI